MDIVVCNHDGVCEDDDKQYFFFRNSSSSDDEPRHTPSPPGPNPHRVKRSALSSFSSLILIFLLYRALFGPTDHEENLRFVRKELKKAKNEAANKW